ncbi:MAG: hypothetical protein ACR2Q4_15975 [Geminicoccaceae bacterium]
MSDPIMAKLVIAALTILATIWCAKHILKLHRISEEFRKYSSEKNHDNQNLLLTFVGNTYLDEHEKILRSDSLTSIFPITLFFIWTIFIILAKLTV